MGWWVKGHEIEEALSFGILGSKRLLNIFCGVVLDDVFFKRFGWEEGHTHRERTGAVLQRSQLGTR